MLPDFTKMNNLLLQYRPPLHHSGASPWPGSRPFTREGPGDPTPRTHTASCTHPLALWPPVFSPRAPCLPWACWLLGVLCSPYSHGRGLEENARMGEALIEGTVGTLVGRPLCFDQASSGEASVKSGSRSLLSLYQLDSWTMIAGPWNCTLSHAFGFRPHEKAKTLREQVLGSS